MWVTVSESSIVWGVDYAHDLWYKTGGQIDTGEEEFKEEWEPVDTELAVNFVNLDVGINGLVWAIEDNGAMWWRAGITTDNVEGTEWHEMDGNANSVAYCTNGNAWATNEKGEIFMRTGVSDSNEYKGTDWKHITEGGLSQVSCGIKGYVWGVNPAGQMYYRVGVTASNIEGTNW